MRWLFLIFVYFLTVCLVHSLTPQHHRTDVLKDSNIVKISQGYIKGYETETTRNFLGIPFAKPPINELRYTAPQDPQPWADVRDATQKGSACPQVKDGFHNVTSWSEDCLYLNVFTPITQKANIPVMLFIYGGSFTSGTGNMYDPEDLVTSQQVIVVNFNYRLGALGFLGLGPSAESSDNSYGNYAIQDQRKAMEWVQQNIAAFGGDPKQVTIFGESAGAISICFHLASKRSAGFFQYALMESGFCSSLLSAEQALNQSQVYAAGLQCNQSTVEDSLNCLRSKSVLEVFTESLKYSAWYPTLDGVEFTEQPRISLENGHFNQVPVLLGTNLNEDSLFSCKQYGNITVDQYTQLILSSPFAPIAKQIFQLYPVSNYDHPVQAYIDFASDLYFKCPMRKVARSISNQSLPAYLYSFQHKPGFSLGDCLNVAHSYELPFLFPSLLEGAYQFTTAEKQLSSTMMGMWSTFARNQDPWTVYSQQQDNNIVLDLTLSYNSHYRDQQCDFWDAAFPL